MKHLAICFVLLPIMILFASCGGDNPVSDPQDNQLSQTEKGYVFLTEWSNGLRDPLGIAVDKSGNVYVADRGEIGDASSSCIRKFTPDGTFMGKWGASLNKSSKDGNLSHAWFKGGKFLFGSKNSNNLVLFS